MWTATHRTDSASASPAMPERGYASAKYGHTHPARAVNLQTAQTRAVRNTRRDTMWSGDEAVVDEFRGGHPAAPVAPPVRGASDRLIGRHDAH